MHDDDPISEIDGFIEVVRVTSTAVGPLKLLMQTPGHRLLARPSGAAAAKSAC